MDIRQGAWLGLGYIDLIVNLRLLLGDVIEHIVVGNRLTINL